MDARLAAILADVPVGLFAQVASRVLDTHVDAIDAPPAFSEITTPHAEARTIGIVRVSGFAGGRGWSSVVKMFDTSGAGAVRHQGVTAPENERLVYERGLFSRDGLPFRPALCYAITASTDAAVTLFWLEDLTHAIGPPFTVDQIAQMARHLGEWNGRHAATPADIGFALLRETYVPRYRGWGFPGQLAELIALGDHPATIAMYQGVPPDVPVALNAAMEGLLRRLETAPHSLAFGDCSAGNLFHTPTETVAVDWASLSAEPIGADGGCFIGSCFTWGRDFPEVIRHERELFDCYVDGLKASSWRGDVDDVRRAAFALMGFYLMAATLVPLQVSKARFPGGAFLEKRFGMPLDEIPVRQREMLVELPRFVAELEALLAR